MSGPRFMIGERGPFTVAELRWMWRRNQIDDTTQLTAEGASVSIPAKAMAGELDAPGEETEVLPPEPEPPAVPVSVEVPGRSGAPALPAATKGRPVLQPVQIVSLKVPFDQVLALCFKVSVAMLIIWIGVFATLWTLGRVANLYNNPSFQQGLRQGMGQ